MADSPLFTQLAGVGKAIARGLGTLVPVTLIQLSDEIDPITRRGAETRVPLEVEIPRGPAGVSLSPDQVRTQHVATGHGLRPDVLVKPGDGMLFGTRRGTVLTVGGRVRDATLRRYVSTCTVQMA